MLVKLVNGCSVNPDNIKHFFVEQKTLSGKKTFIVQVKLDDNSIQPVAYCASKDEAVGVVRTCVQNINTSDL